MGNRRSFWDFGLATRNWEYPWSCCPVVNGSLHISCQCLFKFEGVYFVCRHTVRTHPSAILAATCYHYAGRDYGNRWKEQHRLQGSVPGEALFEFPQHCHHWYRSSIHALTQNKGRAVDSQFIEQVPLSHRYYGRAWCSCFHCQPLPWSFQGFSSVLRQSKPRWDHRI